MSDEKNPYFEEIKEKINIIANKIYETLKNDDTIRWEEVDITWEHHDSGSVCLNLKKLITWQFKDTLRKAYDWEAEQRAKEAEDFKNNKCVKAEDILKIHNQLSAAEKIYLRWDKLEEYFSFRKDVARKLKKWHKQSEYVLYKKPAFGPGPWDYPSRVIISNKDKTDTVEILLEHVDIAKSLKEYYHE